MTTGFFVLWMMFPEHPTPVGKYTTLQACLTQRDLLREGLRKRWNPEFIQCVYTDEKP